VGQIWHIKKMEFVIPKTNQYRGLKLHDPINNEIWTSLFIGLALSESLNLVLLYVCNMQSVYNPKSIHDN
jgi:hypothetical protein